MRDGRCRARRRVAPGCSRQPCEAAPSASRILPPWGRCTWSWADPFEVSAGEYISGSRTSVLSGGGGGTSQGPTTHLAGRLWAARTDLVPGSQCGECAAPAYDTRTEASQGLRALVDALKSEASAAGASRISIQGLAIANEGPAGLSEGAAARY